MSEKLVEAGVYHGHARFLLYKTERDAIAFCLESNHVSKANKYYWIAQDETTAEELIYQWTVTKRSFFGSKKTALIEQASALVFGYSGVIGV